MFEGMSLMNPEFLQVQTFMWIIIDRFLGSVLLLTLPRKGGSREAQDDMQRAVADSSSGEARLLMLNFTKH